MSVEKLARRALRRAAFWRAVVACIDLPGDVLKALAQVMMRVADLFDDLSNSAYYFEADAARDYRTITGVDLGFATSGSLNRYAGTNPKALAQAELDEYDDDGEPDDS